MQVIWAEPSDTGSGELLGYNVRYKPVSDTTWADHLHTGLETSTTITMLTNGVEHEVQVQARNTVGSGPWSDSHTVTPNSKTPQQFAVSSTSNGARVTWETPTMPGLDGFTLYWDAAKGEIHDPPAAQRQVSAASVDADISSLMAGIEYEIRLEANYQDGSAFSSTTKTVIPTASNPPLPAVTNFTVTVDPSSRPLVRRFRGSPVSVTVKSTLPAVSPGQREVLFRELQWAKLDVSGQSYNHRLRLGSDTATVNGLYYQTPHSLRMRAWNLDGPGEWATITTSALFFVPDAPSWVTAVAGDKSLSITWKAPYWNGGATVTGYKVRYRAIGESTWTESPTNWVSEAASIEGLTNGLQYEAQVAAINTVAAGQWSLRAVGTPNIPSISGVMKASSPRDPWILVHPLSSTSHLFSFGWTAPESSGGESITGYKWRRRVVGQTEWITLDLQDPGYGKMSLEHGQYESQMAAVTGVGVGTWTDLINFNVSGQSEESFDDKLDAVTSTYGAYMPWIKHTVNYVKTSHANQGLTDVDLEYSYMYSYCGFSAEPSECHLTDFFLHPAASAEVVVHELAHVYTLVNVIPHAERTVPILWLYAVNRFDPYRDPLGHCAQHEIIADLIQAAVVEWGGLYYWDLCLDYDPSLEDLRVATDAVSGRVPDWFFDTYGGDPFNREEVFSAEYTGDTNAIWQDVMELGERGLPAMIRVFDQYFGGLCSLDDTYYAFAYIPYLHIDNPWECDD